RHPRSRHAALSVEIHVRADADAEPVRHRHAMVRPPLALESRAVPPAELPRRVLVANRGEIALRIGRTCRAMGIEVAAVHSPEDPRAAHVVAADAAAEVPSYLDGAAIVAAARALGCQAIHPGY